jgi:hypothetical protein
METSNELLSYFFHDIISMIMGCFAFFSSGYTINATPFQTVISAFKLLSTFGGPEWRLDLAGEAGKLSRFFAFPKDPFSGVPFSAANGLCNLDFAFADLVGTM